MNSASATTITVNTSIFTAGQLIYVTNKGVGVCTITAGSATVSTTGTLALAQFASGVLYCISAGVFLFEAYGVAASASGLNFLSSTAFTTATSVSLPANTFSATYTNYKVIVTVTAVTADSDLTLRLRAAGTDATTANYDGSFSGRTNASADQNFDTVGGTALSVGEQDSVDLYSLQFDVLSPQVAIPTRLLGQFIGQQKAGGNAKFYCSGGGNFRLTTQFDSLTFISSVASSLTGTITAYGYALS